MSHGRVAVVCVGIALAAVAGPADAKPRCFGAAARDPEHPCDNPALRHSVIPSPTTAAITPNSPCTPVERHDLVNVCLFGVPEASATADIALVGDSHASHWRAAVGVAARARRWRGLSVTHTSCPFSDAVKALPAPLPQQCRRWNREVQAWFRQRPEVRVVLVSEHRGGIPVITRSRDKFDAEVAGYIRAWNRLPASVQHILVIRDNPEVPLRTFPCVVRAAARRERPGSACALLRRRALRRDPAAVAVRRMRSDRVQLVDLTRFFCDATLCLPVVGGALVYKDESHLTRVYARTLGPFLLRRLDALMASWPAPTAVRCPADRCR